MHDQPVYELEALAHHEGIPGHHMQIAIAQELTGIPKFRKLGARFTAYTEGWGLYSELTRKKSGCIRIRILISGDYRWNFCARRDWWWTRVCTRKNGHATKRSIT